MYLHFLINYSTIFLKSGVNQFDKQLRNQVIDSIFKFKGKFFLTCKPKKFMISLVLQYKAITFDLYYVKTEKIFIFIKVV